MDARSIKALRQRMGLTQQAFASLLGLSFVSVNKWENEGSTPTGLSDVLLRLLEGALRAHSVPEVIATLRTTGGAPLEIVRTLAALEQRRSQKRA
ncbi:MAG: helix-turn-helix domain-containing protein [Polyangiaceae bacterium]